MNNPQDFTAEYFLRNAKSNYINYTSKKYDKLCSDLILINDIKMEDTIVEFGCACGLLMNEFKKKRYTKLKGTDISQWAINFGKEKLQLKNELEYFNCNLLTTEKDWLILLDVLEHINTPDLKDVFELIASSKINKGIIVRIPVSKNEGENYVLDVSKNDKTHIQIHSKKFWIDLFKAIGFSENKILNEKTIYDSEGVLARTFYKKR